MTTLMAQGPLDRKVRAQFEHWFSDGGKYPKAIERTAAGGYKLLSAASAWDVWQAAAAAGRRRGSPALSASPCGLPGSAAVATKKGQQ